MKILFDHQVFSEGNYGGIARYFYELGKGLIQENHMVTNSLKYSENVYTRDASLFNSKPFFIPFEFKGRTRIKTLLNRAHSKHLIKVGDYDILHPTFYDPYLFDYIRPGKPVVTTFYDLIDEMYKNDSIPSDLISRRKILLKKSSKIIAISNNTKNDIVNYYNVDPSRVEVIYLSGSLPIPAKNHDKRLGDYILFVGNRYGYKNFDGFVKALAPLLKKETSLKLICGGGGRFTPAENTLIQSLGIQNQVIQQPIDDFSLAELYQNAIFFVFPSQYEGFGIPILEAFNCSCPALLSNVTSLPEIGGDAAIYFNPEDQEEMYEKMQILLYSTDLQEEMRAKGTERAKSFSWKRMTDETVQLYQSLL